MDNASLAAGATVSHYRIVAKIGAGDMGEVYLAEGTRLHRIFNLAWSRDAQQLGYLVEWLTRMWS